MTFPWIDAAAAGPTLQYERIRPELRGRRDSCPTARSVRAHDGGGVPSRADARTTRRLRPLFPAEPVRRRVRPVRGARSGPRLPRDAPVRRGGDRLPAVAVPLTRDLPCLSARLPVPRARHRDE